MYNGHDAVLEAVETNLTDALDLLAKAMSRLETNHPQNALRLAILISQLSRELNEIDFMMKGPNDAK